MIPYEDLVYALAEWRARQGLPTATTPTSAARPVATKPAAPPRPAPAPASIAPASYAAPVSVQASPAYEHGYGAPTPAHATAAYPGAHATQAAFGGAAPVHPAATGAPNLAAVQAAFGGAAHYEHQITDEDEVITLGEAQSSADPLSFEGARAGTQPGVAPGFGHKPGARR